MTGWISDKVRALYDRHLAPAFKDMRKDFGWVADKLEWLYDHGVKPITDDIADAFGDMRDSIKEAWQSVVDHSKTPVNFIIKWVYTKGIKAVWDKVAGFVGLKKLPEAPKNS